MTILRNIGALVSFILLFGVLFFGYAIANPESSSRYHKIHRVQP